MGRKGWWNQIQSDDYPETKIYYGDPRAANWRPETGIGSAITYDTPIKLEDHCPNCNQKYWTDKGCSICGHDREKAYPTKIKLSTFSDSNKIIKKKNLRVAVCCPRCGNKMVMRTARRGKYTGKKFWGCSKFPNCRSVTPYRA